MADCRQIGQWRGRLEGQGDGPDCLARLRYSYVRAVLEHLPQLSIILGDPETRMTGLIDLWRKGFSAGQQDVALVRTGGATGLFSNTDGFRDRDARTLAA